MLDLLRLADGNPGALTFIMEAGKMFDERVDKGFKRMQAHNITGSRLYILWNDCCDRNTEKAIRVMYEENIDEIIKHITHNGRGIPFADKVTIVLEKEAAQMLIKGLSRLIEIAEDYDLLCTDYSNALDELKDTLIFKVGEY
jgi:hypothetical protein